MLSSPHPGICFGFCLLDLLHLSDRQRFPGCGVSQSFAVHVL